MVTTKNQWGWVTIGQSVQPRAVKGTNHIYTYCLFGFFTYSCWVVSNLLLVNSVYQSVLSFVIVAKMELGFQLAAIAFGLCVTAAGFLYFFCDTNLYRGLGEDHSEERALDNDRQQRNRRRGRWISTESPTNENFTANLPLRQRPKPQENDEPLW